ncbi:MAG: DUF2283 domain-containing protein [Anaerolineae bacterium]|nr:DUF2283 domain-containing protein [Anaerolineae bacterium]MDW7991835.1 DUF2283 domain-containing protein [Anaerolineae bacterium]
MKIYYDAEVDALYVQFRFPEPGTVQARPLSEQIIADYDTEGRLVGLEILDVSELLGEERGRLMLEIAPALVVPESVRA